MITLASSSPRRRELIGLTGWPVVLHPVAVDEAPLPDEKDEQAACRLALLKARRAVDEVGAAGIIIGVDTVVVDGETILGKPCDAADARRMLMDLRGHRHRVVSVLALLGSRREVVEVCWTEVPMRRYTRAEVAAYVSSGSPLDKAGAYGIQDRDFAVVALDELHGCFANVMGLPLCHLVRGMSGFGHQPTVNVPLACREFTGYDCAVYADILRGAR